MARRGMNEAQQREQAIQGGQRVIAQGERPFYRVRMTQDGRWEVDACPWLVLDAASRTEALVAARAAVAAMLDVGPDRFDVGTER